MALPRSAGAAAWTRVGQHLGGLVLGHGPLVIVTVMQTAVGKIRHTDYLLIEITIVLT